MWQCLKQSPQSKVQIAGAIASSWDFEREQKLAGPNLVGTAAVAKFLTRPMETTTPKDRKGYDQLLLTYKVLDQGSKAKTIWGCYLAIDKQSTSPHLWFDSCGNHAWICAQVEGFGWACAGDKAGHNTWIYEEGSTRGGRGDGGKTGKVTV